MIKCKSIVVSNITISLIVLGVVKTIIGVASLLYLFSPINAECNYFFSHKTAILATFLLLGSILLVRFKPKVSYLFLLAYYMLELIYFTCYGMFLLLYSYKRNTLPEFQSFLGKYIMPQTWFMVICTGLYLLLFYLLNTTRFRYYYQIETRYSHLAICFFAIVVFYFLGEASSTF